MILAVHMASPLRGWVLFGAAAVLFGVTSSMAVAHPPSDKGPDPEHDRPARPRVVAQVAPVVQRVSHPCLKTAEPARLEASGHPCPHARIGDQADLARRVAALEVQVATLQDIVAHVRDSSPHHDHAPLPAPSTDSSEKVIRIYRLPAGILQDITALLVRDDVPLLVNPHPDGIQVHATAKQHEAFAAFAALLTDQPDHLTWYPMPEQKAEALGKLMARPDVPVIVQPEKGRIGVMGTGHEQRIFAGFLDLIEPGCQGRVAATTTPTRVEGQHAHQPAPVEPATSPKEDVVRPHKHAPKKPHRAGKPAGPAVKLRPAHRPGNHKPQSKPNKTTADPKPGTEEDARTILLRHSLHNLRTRADQMDVKARTLDLRADRLASQKAQGRDLADSDKTSQTIKQLRTRATTLRRQCLQLRSRADEVEKEDKIRRERAGTRKARATRLKTTNAA